MVEENIIATTINCAGLESPNTMGPDPITFSIGICLIVLVVILFGAVFCLSLMLVCLKRRYLKHIRALKDSQQAAAVPLVNDNASSFSLRTFNGVDSDHAGSTQGILQEETTFNNSGTPITSASYNQKSTSIKEDVALVAITPQVFNRQPSITQSNRYCDTTFVPTPQPTAVAPIKNMDIKEEVVLTSKPSHQSGHRKPVAERTEQYSTPFDDLRFNPHHQSKLPSTRRSTRRGSTRATLRQHIKQQHEQQQNYDDIVEKKLEAMDISNNSLDTETDMGIISAHPPQIKPRKIIPAYQDVSVLPRTSSESVKERRRIVDLTSSQQHFKPSSLSERPNNLHVYSSLYRKGDLSTNSSPRSPPVDNSTGEMYSKLAGSGTTPSSNHSLPPTHHTLNTNHSQHRLHFTEDNCSPPPVMPYYARIDDISKPYS